MDKKLRLRVIDFPATAGAAEIEATLNGVCDDGYRLDRLIQTGVPDGIGMRAVFHLRVKTE